MTNNKYNIDIYSTKGQRNYMEDYTSVKSLKNLTVIMVCDGHAGNEIAKITSENLPTFILSKLINIIDKNSSSIFVAEQIQDIVIEWAHSVREFDSGSTLTGIILDENTQKLYIFNIGDSRTCFEMNNASFVYKLLRHHKSQQNCIDQISTNFFCTTDHDHTDSRELCRVKSEGGNIAGSRLNGVLSMTRSLGDSGVGDGLSFIPDVYWTNISDLRGPVVMMSDGVYEPQLYDCPEFTMRKIYDIGVKFGAKNIVETAVEKKSQDNISAVVVNIRQLL